MVVNKLSSFWLISFWNYNWFKLLLKLGPFVKSFDMHIKMNVLLANYVIRIINYTLLYSHLNMCWKLKNTHGLFE